MQGSGRHLEEVVLHVIVVFNIQFNDCNSSSVTCDCGINILLVLMMATLLLHVIVVFNIQLVSL